MSPENEYLLLHDVVPRLRSVIPITVSHVASEDDAELLQDGTVMVAKILTNAQRKVAARPKRGRMPRPRAGRKKRGAHAAGVWLSAARRKHPAMCFLPRRRFRTRCGRSRRRGAHFPSRVALSTCSLIQG
jgi:hypothetical protein